MIIDDGANLWNCQIRVRGNWKDTRGSAPVTSQEWHGVQLFKLIIFDRFSEVMISYESIDLRLMISSDYRSKSLDSSLKGDQWSKLVKNPGKRYSPNKSTNQTFSDWPALPGGFVTFEAWVHFICCQHIDSVLAPNWKIPIFKSQTCECIVTRWCTHWRFQSSCKRGKPWNWGNAFFASPAAFLLSNYNFCSEEISPP